ncbi:MAG: hypothetical protein FWE74_04450 [Oscillospiraceae bacterium]|nr:hypothetical protein [Oscillospiraceae bacterium]
MKTKTRKMPVMAFIISVLMLTALIPVGTAFAAEETFNAQFAAQLDDGFRTDSGLEAVNGWELGDMAAATFGIGEEAIISITFDGPVKFDQNYAAIETNVPYPEFTAAVTSFKLDGAEIPMGAAFINDEGMEKGSTLRLTICNKWNSDIDVQPLDVGELDEFTTIEITFIVTEAGEDAGAAVVEAVPVAAPVVTGGNVIIGGTFYDEEGEMDWVRFDEFPTAFTVGAPFSVAVDLGSETNTHGEASWGYVLAVQTDMDISASGLDAYIERITIDGERNVMFNEENIEVSNERGEGGIRITLTNGWAADPVVLSHERIGEFSKLEVVMAFVEYGAPRPDFSAFALAPAGDAADDAAAVSAEAADGADDSGFPIRIVLIIIGVVLVVCVIFIIIKRKK